ncbi:MAG: hypothetical protein ABNH00_13850 [Dokdonia sp.]|jgi:hypothetical protein
MPVKFSAIFKNTNVKGYFFFLLLTTVLAVIIKLAKNYDTTAVLDVNIKNIPKNLVLTDGGITSLSVDYITTGFMLVANDFTKTPLEIPFDQLTSKSNKYQLPTQEISSLVASHLNAANQKLTIRPSTISFDADSLAQKEVMVVSRHQLDYSSGYGLVQAPTLRPNRVILTGAADVLSAIDTIYTEEVRREALNENTTITLSIDRTNLASDIGITPERVDLDVKVAPFTEGAMDIPISIINADATLQLFPKQTKVFYKVPIDAFEDIRPSDFRVICDFSKKNTATQVMLLEIEKKPEQVTELRLGVNKVQYLIVSQ